jgi:hypothetical protein
MVATPGNKKRINVTFPEPLLEMMDRVVAPRKRNSFIVEATERALRHERLLKAIEQSSGAWSDADHPDLQTDDDIDGYVRRLRETWMPIEDTLEDRANDG